VEGKMRGSRIFNAHHQLLSVGGDNAFLVVGRELGTQKQKKSRYSDKGTYRIPALKIPAASYSPTQLPGQYHRR
jgi:hypothetical protein